MTRPIPAAIARHLKPKETVYIICQKTGHDHRVPDRMSPDRWAQIKGITDYTVEKR